MKPTKEQLSEAARLIARKGGLKGGRARAESLSARRRSAIARAAGAKGNARFEGPKAAAERRRIMRRRTWTAYCAGREALFGLEPEVRTFGAQERLEVKLNPYKRAAFQAPLFDAWVYGFRNAGAELIAFARWRWPMAKSKREGA